MNTPLLDSFEYHGKTIQLEWYDESNVEALSNINWQQVYAVGNLDGKVPVVLYTDDAKNLPGGKVEAGEIIAQTIERELEEEINCKPLSWRPIGYQILTEPGVAEPVYQLRVYAQLEKIGEFVSDPGGSVIGYELVELKDLNAIIGYGVVGERMVQLVASEF